MKCGRWKDPKFWRFKDDELIAFVCWAQERWYELVREYLTLDYRKLDKFERESRIRHQREMTNYWYAAVRELARRQAWDWLNEQRGKSAEKLGRMPETATQ